MDTAVRGIAGVQQAEARDASWVRVGAGGALETVKGFAIHTIGTNLAAAVGVARVDAAHTSSSSVEDTYALLGIEAARAKLTEEIADFIKHTGNAVNPAHFQVYADVMTMTGRVTSIERDGLAAREQDNVLLRMATGDPMRIAGDAAIRGSSTRVYGGAAALALGAMPTVGSHYNGLAIDEDAVRAAGRRSVEEALATL
jgi:DNA-directed RNA polymerase beta' subunit